MMRCSFFVDLFGKSTVIRNMEACNLYDVMYLLKR